MSDLEAEIERNPSDFPVPPFILDYISTYNRLRDITTDIHCSSDDLRTVRAVRLTYGLRKKLTEASLIHNVLDFAVNQNSELNARLSAFLRCKEDDNATYAPATLAIQVPPALEFYCYFLVLIFLIDQRRYDEAKRCSLEGLDRLMGLNVVQLVPVTVLASRLYFYYSYSHEASGDLAEIRLPLLELHKVSILNHDELGQDTLTNLLLRNYLHNNLYDQAEKFRSKAPKFQSSSPQQLCRYLFYLGKIRTIRLEYSDAKDSLQQAAQMAPAAARGFRIQCNKWAVLVRLLLGEIPERTIFTQSGMQGALRPYFELTNAVRIGDLELFSNVAETFSGIFRADRTNNVIVRLRHFVIRAGLRNITISYSRISLADVAHKLKMHSTNLLADVESIVAKAISDRAINATIDHANGWLVLKETEDIYSTAEPQAAFSSRIASCLNLHNEAVRALRFPPKTESDEDDYLRESQVLNEELAREYMDQEETYF